MKISFKGILVGVMLAFLPAFFSVDTSNYVHAEPPKTAVQSSGAFSVPTEFIGNFNLFPDLIKQYNILLDTPSSDTQTIDSAKKGLYYLIKRSYDNYDDRFKALCLFYVSKHPEYLENLKSMGVNSVDSLISAKNIVSNVAIFEYDESGNNEVGTIYGLGLTSTPNPVNLIYLYF